MRKPEGAKNLRSSVYRWNPDDVKNRRSTLFLDMVPAPDDSGRAEQDQDEITRR